MTNKTITLPREVGEMILRNRDRLGSGIIDPVRAALAEPVPPACCTCGKPTACGKMICEECCYEPLPVPPSLEEYRKFMMDKGIDWDSEPEAHFYLHPENEGENGVWCRLVAEGQEYKAAIPSKLFGDWKPDKEIDKVSLSKFTRRPGLDNIFIACTFGGAI